MYMLQNDYHNNLVNLNHLTVTFFSYNENFKDLLFQQLSNV